MKPTLADLLKLPAILANARRYGPASFADYEARRDACLPLASSTAARKPLIYTLTIECAFGINLTEPCVRVIEIKDTATLLNLHYVIQQAVEFDDDHLFDFFVGPNWRSRKIAFRDESCSESDAVIEEVTLRRIWPLPKGMKLFYWFDFGDDWKFQITKARAVKPPQKGIRYPRLVQSFGRNPKQYRDEDW